MERKYLEDLIRWNNDPDRKPLMVWGARQVGKTYLLEELFAKAIYPHRYLRIDCSDDINFVSYVNANPSFSKVLDYLKVQYDFIDDGEHLLIIDEAQECLAMVRMMKQFCEMRRDIPLIVTGSLVRLKIFRDSHKRGGYARTSGFLFPVGKINQLYMYPLTFDEFLFNYHKEAYSYIYSHFKNKEVIDKQLHEHFLELFYDYLFVGGMPEVVDTFLKHKDDKVKAYALCVNKIKEIYDNYLADMDLYQASPEAILRSRAIYKDIYHQLNKENKNFKYSLTIEGAKARDMLNPLLWLIEAKVVHQSFLVKEKVSAPLIKEEDSLMRLYLSDIGLFTYQSGLSAKSFLLDKENSLSGIYFENYVANELAARNKDLFYWKGKRNAELEFLIDIEGEIVPLDVKKRKGKLTSLSEYKLHNKLHFAIKVSANEYGYDESSKILTLPFYYFPFYLDELQKYN